MHFFAAIYIKDGKCIHLHQGEKDFVSIGNSDWFFPIEKHSLITNKGVTSTV